MLPETAKKAYIDRLKRAASILSDHKCSRQEIFAFCLTGAVGLLIEVCQRYNPPVDIVNLMESEQIVADAIGEVMQGYPE